MIYFTADNHFCHSNIIELCNRSFSDVNEMNNTMIDNWNSIVTKNDEVYILGDFAYKAKIHDINEILFRLKGRKYLVKGNHEKYLNDPLFDQNAFEWVNDYFILVYEKLEYVLFHYPMLSWYKSYHGSIHLYGHVNNSAEKHPDFAEKIKLLGSKAINVGVDVNDFYPVSIKQIQERVKDVKDELNSF